MKNVDQYCEKLAVEKLRGVKIHPLVKLGRANVPMIAEDEKRKGKGTPFLYLALKSAKKGPPKRPKIGVVGVYYGAISR